MMIGQLCGLGRGGRQRGLIKAGIHVALQQV
jgi:hypothetical protein